MLETNSSRDNPDQLPSCLFRLWIHSHEEDSEGVKVYRPSDYKFPPSRGRNGFEIKVNGEFIYYGIAPTDGSKKFIGYWQEKSNHQIDVYMEERTIRPYRIYIFSCDESILRIEP